MTPITPISFATRLRQYGLTTMTVRRVLAASLLLMVPMAVGVPSTAVAAEPYVRCRPGKGCCSTNARCFYVSPDGNDVFNGRSERRAVKTLDRVHELVSKRRITRPIEVRIKQGTYYTDHSVEWTTYHPVHSINFMPADYTYGDWGSFAGRPIFDGSRARQSHWFSFSQGWTEATNLRFYYLQVQHYTNGIVLAGKPRIPARWNGYNKIYGMYFRELGQAHDYDYEPECTDSVQKNGTAAPCGYGAVVLVNSRHNEIRNNHFVDIENCRPGLDDGVEGCVIEKGVEVAPHLWDDGHMHALYLKGYAHSNDISDNRMENIGGAPVRVRDFSNNNVIDRNVMVAAGDDGYYSDWYSRFPSPQCKVLPPECLDAEGKCMTDSPGCERCGQNRQECGTSDYVPECEDCYAVQECPSWQNTFRDNELLSGYNGSGPENVLYFVYAKDYGEDYVPPRCDDLRVRVQMEPDSVDHGARASLWTHFGTGTGVEYLSTFQWSGFWSNERWLVGDFNGDGHDDLLNVYGNSTDQARAWVQLWTGAGFDYMSTIDTLAGYWDSQRWLVGDFNGDGRDDLVNVYGNEANVARAWVHLSTGAGFAYESSFTPLAVFSEGERWLVGDFNGDGRADLVNVYGNDGHARAWVHLSTGSGFEYQSSFTSFAAFSDSQRWLVGDFDGDGMDDLVNVYGNSGEARAWVHRSTGSGFEYQSSFTPFAGFSDSQRWLVGDFDGDGMDDLVNVYGNSGEARAWVHQSTGSGFEHQSSFTTLAGFWDSQRWLVGDFDGDGVHDLIDIYQAP